MRHKLVFGVLALLLGGFGAALALRGRQPHEAPRPPTDSPASSSSAPTASSGSAPAASASAPAADAGPGMLMPRPLRVAGLGWESVAPNVLALKTKAGDAPAPFAAAGIEVTAKGVEKLETLESALGRGGEDPDGADVAILPLASFVASYERLRALSPEIFFVVGWSRGREALLSTKDPLVTPPAAGDVRVGGVAGEAATFFGLAALDLAGTPPDRIKLVAAPKADDVALAAIDRGAPSDAGSAKLRMTTADASRLVPLVAVAQRGTIEKHGPALVAWARVWLDAQRTLESDPAAAARVVSTAQGAPEPIALLRRLGELAPAPLADNARVAGLSGRGAVTLETLFQSAWRIWRAAGVLATPAPDSAPVSTSIIAALARSNPGLVQPAPAPKPKTASDKSKVLLVHRHGDGAAKIDEPALLSSIGLLAGVFERAPLRVTVRGAGGVDAKRTQKLIEAAQGQFDLPAGRLVAGTKAVDKSSAAVEVLEVP